MSNIQVIADTIHYRGEAVARITVKTSTVRDRFEAELNAEQPEGVSEQFAAALFEACRDKAQANAITLDELASIIEKLQA